ncbi:hypothetical protein D3C85_987850 [compost metagenome]
MPLPIFLEGLMSKAVLWPLLGEHSKGKVLIFLMSILLYNMWKLVLILPLLVWTKKGMRDLVPIYWVVYWLRPVVQVDL